MKRVTSNTKVLDAYDIIDHFTNSEMRNITFDDAKNALAVYNHANDVDKRQLNSLIWARVIASEIETSEWRVSLVNAMSEMS